MTMSNAFARNSDPITSHGGVDAIKPHVTKREQEVLEALRWSIYGLTINELATKLGRSVVSISPRLKPLVVKGLVVDSGSRKDGHEGRSRIVWRIK